MGPDRVRGPALRTDYGREDFDSVVIRGTSFMSPLGDETADEDAGAEGELLLMSKLAGLKPSSRDLGPNLQE